MNDEIDICDSRIHEAAKRDVFSFAMATTRMPEHEDAEAYVTECGVTRWWRQCRYCPSTLAMKVQDVAQKEAAA